METKLYQTAKEFFKFLNNYEADIWIRGNKAFDVNGELIAEYNIDYFKKELEIIDKELEKLQNKTI